MQRENATTNPIAPTATALNVTNFERETDVEYGTLIPVSLPILIIIIFLEIIYGSGIVFDIVNNAVFTTYNFATKKDKMLAIEIISIFTLTKGVANEYKAKL